MQKVDKKTLAILKAHYPFADDLSDDDKAYLLSQHIAIGEIKILHDEVCQLAMDAYQKVSKSQVINSYLYGLAHQLPAYRSAWSAYARMTHCCLHSFNSQNNYSCEYCGSPQQMNVDLLTAKFIALGGFTFRDLYGCYLVLSTVATDFDNKSIAIGEQRLIELLKIIQTLPDDISPTALVKILKSKASFKIGTLEDIRHIINTLGICGILKAKDKPSFLDEYILASTETHKSHSSDWSYPVDFWLSQDGICIKAINYWFDDFPNIIQAL